MALNRPATSDGVVGTNDSIKSSESVICSTAAKKPLAAYRHRPWLVLRRIPWNGDCNQGHDGDNRRHRCRSRDHSGQPFSHQTEAARGVRSTTDVVLAVNQIQRDIRIPTQPHGSPDHVESGSGEREFWRFLNNLNRECNSISCVYMT